MKCDSALQLVMSVLVTLRQRVTCSRFMGLRTPSVWHGNTPSSSCRAKPPDVAARPLVATGPFPAEATPTAADLLGGTGCWRSRNQRPGQQHGYGSRAYRGTGRPNGGSPCHQNQPRSRFLAFPLHPANLGWRETMEACGRPFPLTRSSRSPNRSKENAVVSKRGETPTPTEKTP
jgi:hypothetical protein